MSDVYLILHGWGGNKPAHWQEHLAAKLTEDGEDVRYPKMPEPMSPDPIAWMEALHTALREIPADATVTVLAHSRPNERPSRARFALFELFGNHPRTRGEAAWVAATVRTASGPWQRRSRDGR